MKTINVALCIIFIPIVLGIGLACIIGLFYSLGYGISRLLEKLDVSSGFAEAKTMILVGALVTIPLVALGVYVCNTMFAI